jgi:hypothetical protein
MLCLKEALLSQLSRKLIFFSFRFLFKIISTTTYASSMPIKYFIFNSIAYLCFTYDQNILSSMERSP